MNQVRPKGSWWCTHKTTFFCEHQHHHRGIQAVSFVPDCKPHMHSSSTLVSQERRASRCATRMQDLTISDATWTSQCSFAHPKIRGVPWVNMVWRYVLTQSIQNPKANMFSPRYTWRSQPSSFKEGLAICVVRSKPENSTYFLQNNMLHVVKQ